MRWEPFKDLLSLQDRMNRLFEETVARGTVREEAKSGQWSPAVDILEAEGEIILRAELPGVDLNAIDIQIKDNVLTLRGERTFENQVKKEHYYRIERSYGAFQRSFQLPADVDDGKVEATFNKGVLKVVVPKKPQAKASTKKIEVKKAA